MQHVSFVTLFSSSSCTRHQNWPVGNAKVYWVNWNGVLSVSGNVTEDLDSCSSPWMSDCPLLLHFITPKRSTASINGQLLPDKSWCAEYCWRTATPLLENTLYLSFLGGGTSTKPRTWTHLPATTLMHSNSAFISKHTTQAHLRQIRYIRLNKSQPEIWKSCLSFEKNRQESGVWWKIMRIVTSVKRLLQCVSFSKT